MIEQPPPPPPAGDAVSCPGCGGRNRANASECDWCGRPFASGGSRLRISGWQLVSVLLVVALVAAVAVLAFLNTNRPLAPRAVPPTATLPASPLPTPVVTPRVTAAPAATAAPTSAPATPTPPPEPTPEPPRAVVARTGGSGVVVRAQAGPQAARVTTLREGTQVVLTGGEETIAARQWSEVHTEDGSVSGWVATEFLDPVP